MHPSTRSDRPAPNWPPREVRTVCETYLDLVDEVLPGLVEGFYLHGSVGFGEWYAGRSDIDYVAVFAHRPDEPETVALRAAYTRLTGIFPTPAFDGMHVTWSDLADNPARCPDVLCSFAGELGAGRADLHPVTWHELAGHGVVIRGPRLEDVKIWTDHQVLREYTHENLRTYWAEQARQAHTLPDDVWKPEEVTWVVLGVTRLHHLLATDRLISKSAAGRYAVEAFGERWRPLVDEALAYRATGQPLGAIEPAELSAQVLEFFDLVLADGLAIRP